MPVKQRIAKSRRMEAGDIEDMLHGPGTSMLAGVGYFRCEFGGYFHNLKPDQQAAVIDAMREDWAIHRDRIMAHAEAAGIAEPWALREFGRPSVTEEFGE